MGCYHSNNSEALLKSNYPIPCYMENCEWLKKSLKMNHKVESTKIV
jgi:hypothetical protein